MKLCWHSCPKYRKARPVAFIVFGDGQAVKTRESTVLQSCVQIDFEHPKTVFVPRAYTVPEFDTAFMCLMSPILRSGSYFDQNVAPAAG